MLKKKIGPFFKELLNQKLSLNSQKYGFGIQGPKRHRIPDPDPQSWQQRAVCSGRTRMKTWCPSPARVSWEGPRRSRTVSTSAASSYSNQVGFFDTVYPFLHVEGLRIPVLLIHDIMVWIWIQNRGYMPLINRSGFRILFFSSLTFKKKFFCLLLFEGTFTSLFKDKKSKRSHKTVGIKVFLTILLDGRRIRIRIQIQEAQKHMDPIDLDPDPQHWRIHISELRNVDRLIHSSCSLSIRGLSPALDRFTISFAFLNSSSPELSSNFLCYHSRKRYGRQEDFS